MVLLLQTSEALHHNFEVAIRAPTHLAQQVESGLIQLHVVFIYVREYRIQYTRVGSHTFQLLHHCAEAAEYNNLSSRMWSLHHLREREMQYVEATLIAELDCIGGVLLKPLMELVHFGEVPLRELIVIGPEHLIL
jgi:hypothetical protein